MQHPDISFVGRLGKDPEVHIDNGVKRTVFSVCVDRTKKKDAKADLLWLHCISWGDSLDKKMPYLKKGTSVHILGELRDIRPYETKDGSSVGVLVTVAILRLSFVDYQAKTVEEIKAEEN